MSELDPRSLIVVAGLLGLLCSAILFILRRSFPPTVGGLVYWSRGVFCLVLSSALFGMTGRLPVFLCVVVANVVLVAGILQLYAGFRDFARLPLSRMLFVAVTAGATIHVLWFTYVDSHYPARAFGVTAVNATLFLASALLVRRTGGSGLSGRFTCMVLGGIGAVSALRAAMLALQFDTPPDLLDPTATQRLYLAAMAFAVLAITLGAMMMANDRLRAALEFIASHDQLTDAYTRRAFLELLHKELARSARSLRPLALLMCDLDNFKSINDRHGHTMGDRVIVDFVRRTRTLLRNMDSIGRYGGEEFIILLPETTTKQAQQIAERLCAEIATASPDGLPRYTVSIGVAACADGEPGVDELLMRADRALYRAKEDGRNRVEMAMA
ncbi:MAG TPA: GGDEF domain-containing protein [Noviherbaspirillum sp.]|uniref:GGDEF domain-containing protein n=1 Tax=Noviherbaspirillum sp. TaxID=1926288 RepID=UPI002F932D48